ncbi:MAG: toll/interleukin receptor protein [Flavipsychrobacter sp.]|nr:toll/interleukin receptor protein [Flavipsychrobacter sp.]
MILFAATMTTMSFGAVVFTACTKVQCENIVCKNGGSCSNGVCSCPTGYTGTFCESAATSYIVYKNNTFTPIVITVNGAGLTIPVGGSVSYSGKFGTDATGTATTSGAATSLGISTAGGILGLPINWSINNTFPSGDTLRVPLDVGAAYFFLRLKNTGSKNIINYYVNKDFTYGEYYNDVTVPNDSKVYEMGYYLAYPGSNVQTQATNSSSPNYVRQTVTLPFVSNQSVTVTIGD